MRRRLALAAGFLLLTFGIYQRSSSARPSPVVTAEEAARQPALKKILSGSDMNLRIDEGTATHFLLRDGKTAAHVNLLSGKKPRLLVAYPAGNSGTSVWFDSPGGDVEFTSTVPPEALPGGRFENTTHELRGVKFEVLANRDRLLINSAILGSVRHIRDWDLDRIKPSEITERVTMNAPNQMTYWRRSLDGKSFYEMKFTVHGGTITRLKSGAIEFKSTVPNSMRLDIESASADPALTPIHFDKLLKPEYLGRTDQRSLQLLAFLMYEEKFLAGSWTYLTYFGRDTLLSLRLLLDALQPEAVEAMLGSVINRVSGAGDVAHEEEIGDYAASHNIRLGRGAVSTPVYDYEMIDDDFLLPAILWQYVKRNDLARTRAFFSRRTDTGVAFRDAIAVSLRLVINKGRPFAEEPIWQNLIALKPGHLNGQWRDSHEGLGLGRFPFDVNVAMVPAALKAASHLFASRELGMLDMEASRTAMRFGQVWAERASGFFDVVLDAGTADKMASDYAATLKLVKATSAGGTVRFSALSLDEHGRPVPVMHSDEGFRMLFVDPDPEALEAIASSLVRPFPYGLRSRVGMLIANPAFANAEKQSLFTTAHYHGTVVWSWQQAMMAAGLARQIKRRDLPASTRKTLRYAQSVLWGMIRATQPYRTAELWSWRPENGVMVYVPYGQGENDHTEANPDQGWSHAFLGLIPPQ